MISDWRRGFAQYGADPFMPFVFVQLQPCGIPPSMRYAQALSITAHSGVPNVDMAACFDLGDPDPKNAMGLCHSRYKTECGRRLALEVHRLLPPPAPLSAAAAAVVATVNQADTAWILISTGESARASDACPASG